MYNVFTYHFSMTMQLNKPSNYKNAYKYYIYLLYRPGPHLLHITHKKQKQIFNNEKCYAPNGVRDRLQAAKKIAVLLHATNGKLLTCYTSDNPFNVQQIYTLYINSHHSVNLLISDKVVLFMNIGQIEKKRKMASVHLPSRRIREINLRISFHTSTALTTLVIGHIAEIVPNTVFYKFNRLQQFSRNKLYYQI